MKIFAFGSSIVSSYWNGAATYYRGCYKYLSRRGHEITFAEPDAYGRQQHRDSDDFSYVRSIVYRPGADLDAMLMLAGEADVIVKHSGIGVDDEMLERCILELQDRSAITFWDVDAPATIARMHSDGRDAFRISMPQYDAVLTYGGGPWCREQYLALGARAYFSMYNLIRRRTTRCLRMLRSYVTLLFSVIDCRIVRPGSKSFSCGRLSLRLRAAFCLGARDGETSRCLETCGISGMCRRPITTG